jgi:cytochrome c2
MRRPLSILAAVLVGGGIIAGAAGVAGYYAHKNRLDPVYSLAERVELKIRRTAGLKSDTDLAVERIETIFTTLNGRSHVMPGRDFQNGGALTVWGDDLLVMHKSGKVFWLDRDEAEGMVLSNLRLPDNGRDGYERLAAEKYPGRPTRIDALRYNDIEFIETAEHRGLLLSYTFVDVAAECYRSRINWLPLPAEIASIRDIDAGPDDWQLLFETSPCLAFNETNELMMAYMSGGRMAFKAPDTVYLGSGEYHLDGIYRPDAGIQSDDSDYGKTIAIDLRTGAARHISKGHRNLQGVTLDAEGRLWTTEHGMRGGDELNLIVEGENYGWPLEDMGTLYSGVPQANPNGPGRHLDFRPPVYAWVPSAAVSSLALVEGFHPAWDGDILIGSLKERTLFRARIMDDRLVSLEPIPIGQRVRDVVQWGPDRIALWLDVNEVVILEVEPFVDPLEGIEDMLVADGLDAALAKTTTQTLAGCAECHSYEPNIHGAGPSLAKLVDRPVASTGFSGYSTALSSFQGAWTPERLAAYLEDPAALVPGTAMTGMGVGDPAAAAALVQAFTILGTETRP